MITIDSKAAKQRVDTAEQVPIFEIDGTIYSVPRVERSEVALRYLDVANTRGEDAANYYLLTEMLGQDGFDALMAVEGLERSDFDAVVDQVSKIVMPAANPKGRRG